MRARRPSVAAAAADFGGRRLYLLTCVVALAGCTDKTDADFRAGVAAEMHDSIVEDLQDLATAAGNLQSAAPTRSWTKVPDPLAVARMQDAWKRTRIAWEHVEGAIAPLFPAYNDSMDSRYDEFLPKPGMPGDRNPFDGTGVVGMHAIERILFAHDIRPEILIRENGLWGSMPPAYPDTDDEAIAFKTQLVQRLIDDTNDLIDELRTTELDIAMAYGGLVSLMSEQREKVRLAASGEEESRYANITLFDLRNNLDGTKKVYALFRDWIVARSAETADRRIRDRFMALMAAYYTTNSDALPEAPAGWSPDNPTPETPFGALWMEVRSAVDPAADGSVVFEMNRVASVLGFPAFVAE